MISLKLCRNTLIRLLVVFVIISSLAIPPAMSQESEDSQVFIAGFNAYQQKDYASSIAKMNEVLQKYPDTPLRDMALFWLSRAYYKSGNQNEAARFLSQFSKEYPDNPLKGTVEEELLSLTARYEKGEKLPSGQQVAKQPDRVVAQKTKVAQERIAAEQAAKAKAEQERIAAAKAEEARLAAVAAAEAARIAALKQTEEKATAEKKEQQRLAAVKAEEDRKATEKTRLATTKQELERITAEQALAAEEQARITAEQERMAAEQAAKLKAELERVASEKKEQERLAAVKAEQERLAAVKAEQERIAAEQAAKAKSEQERMAAAKAEETRLAAIAAAEAARIAALKQAEEKAAAEKKEQERIAAVKAEQERIAAVKAEEARLAAVAAAEAARIATLKQAEEKAAAEKNEQIRLAAVKAEQDRIAAEQVVKAKAEQERVAAEKKEQQRLAALKAEEERKAAEAARLAALKQAEEKAAAQKKELERLAAVKAEQERIVAAKAEEARLAAAEAARIAAVKKAEEKAAAEKVEQDRLAAVKAEQERIAAVKAEEARLAAAEAARIAALKQAEQKAAAEKIERERLAAAQVEQERVATVQAELTRLAETKKERERLAAVKAEQDRIAAEQAARAKAEQERIAALKAEEARVAAAAAEAARIAAIKQAEEKATTDKKEFERQAAIKAEEQLLATQKAADEKIRAEKNALREKAIAQYKSIIDKYPGSSAAASAAAKLRELGLAVALPQVAVAEPVPENAQILRLEVAQYAGFEFNLMARPEAYHVAQRVNVPFEITNRGNGNDAFYLESAFPDEFKAQFAATSSPDAVINQTPVLAQGETFRGIVSLVIPATSIDGLRITHPVKAASKLMAEASQSREIRLIASAPLLRAVLKTDKTQPLPGDKIVYRIAVLNVGSTVAKDVTFRLNFPPQLEPVDYAAAGFKQEMKSALVFDGLQVNSGESRELSVTFQLKEDSLAGQELATRAELINNPLKTTAAFVSNMAYVQPQRAILVRTGSERLVAIPGQTISVPFVVTNTGNVREKFRIASNVKGAQDAVVFHDINRDAIRQASEPVITEIGPLAPKEEASVVVEIKTPRSAGDGNEGNVLLSFTSEGDTTRTASGSTRLLYSRPVLQMAMAGRDGRLKPGEVASFDLAIINKGSNLARVVELQSAWPEQLELVAADPANSTFLNGNITWRFKEMGAGEKRSIKVSFRVKPGTGVGTNIQVKNILTYEDQLGNRY